MVFPCRERPRLESAHRFYFQSQSRSAAGNLDVGSIEPRYAREVGAIHATNPYLHEHEYSLAGMPVPVSITVQ